MNIGIAVNLPAADMLAALVGFCHSFLAEPADEGIAHISDGSAAVETSLVFHLNYDMLDSLFLVLVEIKCFQYQRIPLYDLAGGKS